MSAGGLQFTHVFGNCSDLLWSHVQNTKKIPVLSLYGAQRHLEEETVASSYTSQ